MRIDLYKKKEERRGEGMQKRQQHQRTRNGDIFRKYLAVHQPDKVNRQRTTVNKIPRGRRSTGGVGSIKGGIEMDEMDIQPADRFKKTIMKLGKERCF